LRLWERTDRVAKYVDIDSGESTLCVIEHSAEIDPAMAADDKVGGAKTKLIEIQSLTLRVAEVDAAVRIRYAAGVVGTAEATLTGT
tara:strand:+ start:191 stop:448 length:258 start_codon:yes stop_codon:yes gene_type:complete